MSGETLQGRRVPDAQHWYGDHRQDGDYGRVQSDGTWIWYACTPNGHMGNLAAHQVTEHEDGSITVSPSILILVGPHVVWHGYLEHGVWRSV